MKETKIVNLFYIGEKFYEESNTFMSPIYEVDTYERYDWGFVSIKLKAGITVNIRPATKKEMLWAKGVLKSYER